MECFSKRDWQKVITLFLMFAVATCGRTQNDIGTFSVDGFERVQVNAELELGATYLIGSVVNEGEMYFLTSEKEGKKINKLKAKQLSKGEQGQLLSTAECLWRIECDDTDRLRLQTAEDGLYLKRKSNESTDLLLSDAVSADCSWYGKQNADGTFHLYATNEQQRQLIVDQNTNGGYSYANYSTFYIKDRSLIIYKKVGEKRGENKQPIHGQVVCLASPDGMQVCAENGGTILAEDGILQDGSVARMEGLGVWSVEYIDKSSFALKGNSGYLSYNMQERDEKYAWTIDNGWFGTTEEEPRYMIFNGMEWTLTKEKPQRDSAVRLVCVADVPTQRVDENGVCQLEGGWTASQLSGLSLDGVRCLDLTAISIPLKVKTFSQQPTASNMMIYVKESERTVAQMAWHWVVSCGELGNVLCDERIELIDKQPLFTDRDVEVKDGQIVYVRPNIPKEQWQTFSLPFNAEVAEGKVFRLIEEKSGELVFEKVSQMMNDEGYIGMADSNGQVCFSSKAGVIKAHKETSTILKGIAEVCVVGPSDGAIFMLHPTEQCFKRAAVGSTLSPFRAYLIRKGLNKTNAMKIRMK